MNRYIKISLIVLMSIVTIVAIILYYLLKLEIILSFSIILNLLISYYLILKNSPDLSNFKLVLFYLIGFTLFICGRYIANIFGIEDTYCFEFIYEYCLDNNEIIYSNILVNFSLISFVLGYIVKSKQLLNKDNRVRFVNKNILKLWIFITFIVGIFVIYFTISNIIKAISYGYMSLYEGQAEIYQPPMVLIINTLFISLLSNIFAHRNIINPFYFKTLIFILLSSLILSVLTGGRGGFVSALLILIWFYLGNSKVTLRKLLILPIMLLLILSANVISSVSGARISGSLESRSLFQKIFNDIFYQQGTSLMVFNIGTLNDNYPLLAYLKTVFPGIQFIYSHFYNIYPYEMSFSQNLTYKLAPEVYYGNMGWGWTILGDFYAFSFGSPLIFILYNFLWGKMIFTISKYSNRNEFYKGLYFCFLLNLFTINRGSVSPLIFTCLLYILIYYSMKLRLR